MFSTLKKYWSISITQYEDQIKNCHGHHDDIIFRVLWQNKNTYHEKKREREKKRREKGLSKAVLSINIFEKLNFFNWILNKR